MASGSAAPGSATPGGRSGKGMWTDADQPLARRVACAVRAVPGVVDLDGGQFGEIATYLTSERVGGVQLADESGSVHIVVDLRHDLRQVAAEAAAVAAELTGFPVSVTVEDVTFADPGSGPGTEGEDDE